MKTTHTIDMLFFIKFILIVYLIAVNIYAFLLLKSQKTAKENGEKCFVQDSRLIIAGLFGGAIAIYTGMFIFKYRLQSFFLMVLMPVLIAVNVYFVIFCFVSSFGIVVDDDDIYGITTSIDYFINMF